MRRLPPSHRRKADYEVGYGRPPKATQFKPGQSGCPTGRPKGSKSVQTLFNEALREQLEIQERGILRKMTASEVIVKRLVNEAMKGNLKTAEFVLARMPELASDPEPSTAPPQDASPEDLLKMYRSIMVRPKG